MNFDNTFTDIPVLYTFGNNDNTKHYGDYTEDHISPYKIAKANGLDGQISHNDYCFDEASRPCLLAESQLDGHYAGMFDENLEIININSVYLSRKYSGDEQKSTAELEFLKRQLSKVQKAKNSVLIATHIPVENDSYDNKNLWKKEYTEKFIDIIKEYKDTVIGIVNGHTHTEELRILPIDDNTNIGEYTTPSLTTTVTNAPGFKSFTLAENDNKWSIKDYTAYIFVGDDIADLKIKELYTFSSEYCQNNSYNENINNCLKNVTLANIDKFIFLQNPNVTPREYTNNSLIYLIRRKLC